MSIRPVPQTTTENKTAARDGGAARLLARIVGVVVALIGIFVLTGWEWNIPAFKTVYPGLVTMKANTALGLVLGGIAQVVLAWRKPSGVRRGAAAGLAVILGILGGLILSEYLFTWNPGIDELLFRDPTPSIGTSAPGRMAPSTAFCLVLVAIGIMAACRAGSPRFRVSLLAAFGSSLMAIGGIGCVGQTMDVLFGFSTWNYFGMALHTAAGTALLGAGFLALSRNEGKITWSVGSRVTCAFIAAVLVLLTAAGCSWSYTHQLEKAAMGVSRAHEVLKKIEEIRADRAIGESNLRGFIILADEKMLNDRLMLRAEILADLASVRQMTAADDKQQNILDQIDALMKQRIANFNEILTVRRQQGFEAAQRLLATGPNLALGARITALVIVLRDNETADLAVSERNVELTSTTTYLILPLAVFLSLTILALTLFFLNEQVDERMRAEAEIWRLNAGLEQRVSERTKALEEANRELEAFSYSVSHDLRAPLRSIDEFSRLVQEDHGSLLPEEGRRALGKVRKGAQRMGNLIDDLLAFSKVSQAPWWEETVDMDALVGEAIEELRPEMKDRKVEIKREPLPSCRGDLTLLKQVWTNLLANAVKYSRQREPAVIEIFGQAGEMNTYGVRDNGAGFDMRYAGKLFRVFQRLHSASEFEGTGAGLAIVQRIIHRHGGTIRAEAEVGKGATFFFTLKSAAQGRSPEAGG